MDEQLELEAQIQQEMAGSADFLEGAMAFVEKRPAAFHRTEPARAFEPSWQTSSSASRPGLNRIPAALGHLLPSTLAFFTPAPGALAERATSIDTLYKITLVHRARDLLRGRGRADLRAVKFRKRKGAVAAQIHGNTRLEVGWTAGAAVILLALAVLTFAKLSSIQDPPNSGPEGVTLGEQNNLLYASTERKLPPNGKSLNIQVIGRQYIWQFVYPGANEPDGLGAPYSYEEMVVPTNTTVSLDIVSADVVHSWWIPELGGKFQASRATTTTPGSRSTSRASTAGSARSCADAATRA